MNEDDMTAEGFAMEVEARAGDERATGLVRGESGSGGSV